MLVFAPEFAVRIDSNRHRFAMISNRTIRITRSEIVRIAVKALVVALLFLTFKTGFKLRDLIR